MMVICVGVFTFFIGLDHGGWVFIRVIFVTVLFFICQSMCIFVSGSILGFLEPFRLPAARKTS